MSANNLTMIDLFAGAGGLSEGLSEAGFHSLFASEIMHEYARTYSLNHTDAIVRTADIRTLDAEAIRRELNIERGELDLIEYFLDMAGVPHIKVVSATGSSVI